MAKRKALTPDDDGRQIAVVLDDLITQEQKDDVLELVLRPRTALALASLVQIGLHHLPFGFRAGTEYGDAFIAAVRVFFKDAPAVLELLDKD